MLVRLFRSNRSGILAVLLLLVPVLFYRHFFSPVPSGALAMPFHGQLLRLFAQAAWVQGATIILVILVVAIQLTALVNDSDLVDRRNHLPALLFPILLATVAAPGSLGPALFGMPFVIWSLKRSWSINSGGAALGALFDAGFLISLASLFYMPYAFLIVVVWASVSVIRPFQWREYLIPLLAMAIVFYLTWGVLYLTGHSSWEPLRTVTRPPQITDMISGSYRVTLLTVLVPMLVVSMLGFVRQYTKGVVREQNLRSAFLAFVVSMGVMISLVVLLNGWYPAALPALPLSMLLPFALLSDRRQWLGEAAVFALLILALWMQFGK